MTDWQAVAEAVRARRTELTLTQAEAVAKSDGLVSTAVWNNIENARQESYRQRSLLGVAKALHWPGDALEQIGNHGATKEQMDAVGGRLAALQRATDPYHQAVSELDQPEEDARELAGLAGKLERLTDVQRAAIEAVVDEILDKS